MKTTSIYTFFFSPTGTSRKIATAVAQGMSGSLNTECEKGTEGKDAAETGPCEEEVTGQKAIAEKTGYAEEGTVHKAAAEKDTDTEEGRAGQETAEKGADSEGNPPIGINGSACVLQLPVTAIDLTHPAGQPAPLRAGAVAIFAVPVYGGHVAPAALERMRELRGEGTPAVVLAVYGNRSFGTAVAELAALVAGRGFIPVAAGAFVGEHSYSTPETPIAHGRPDARDLAAAAAFGVQVREKITKIQSAPGTMSRGETVAWRNGTDTSSGTDKPGITEAGATHTTGKTGTTDTSVCPGTGRTGTTGAEIAQPPGKTDITDTSASPGTGTTGAVVSHTTGKLIPIDPAKLREPRTPLLAKLRFIRFVLGYRRRQKRRPVVLLPEGNAARCTQCGRCVALCPTQAISRGDELHTDPTRCIRCCACVKGCAFGARTFHTPFAAVLARDFDRRKPPVTLL